MTVELRPMGVACNLGCTYCYQEPMREAGNINTKYDLDKMIEEVERVGQNFHLFGGEALLVPKKDLEVLWKYGYEKFGSNGIQTNGTLIDDGHIELFKKYNVSVGISIDGWEDLNDLREIRAGVRGTDKKLKSTREGTEATIRNIEKVKKAGVPVSVIITLHKQNASKEQLPSLLKFMRWLGDVGVKAGNLHTLEVDATMPDQEKHVLSQEENIESFLTIAKFLEENTDLRYSPFNEYASMVRGDDQRGTCIWKFCDPMNTQAVYGVEGDGALSNCGRTNKEGIDWYKADDNSYGRYISFYHTPPEYGGCKGCRFYMMCSGSCPGESDQNDFRNKTIHCKTQQAMLGHYEKVTESLGMVPLTKHPLRKQMEQRLVHLLSQGERPSLRRIKEEVEKSAQKQQSKQSQVQVRK